MAVEFNGPSHYCHVVSLAAPHGSAATGAPEMARRGTLLLNGKARLKQRILELSGWTGIHVSFFEWDAARGDHRAQDVLLRRKLAAHAVSPAAADPHGETVAKKRRKSGEKATDLLHAEKAAPAAKRPEDDAYEVYDVSDTWR
ncbi:hypothetical protein M885DRAFT_333781 [Pelagophyceae sp. CCMP2097]|nr:hypothetical protein M885DRAFT_333781 [Pelagophyceae sp. CCMP2097]